jgi:hypothetical protein
MGLFPSAPAMPLPPIINVAGSIYSPFAHLVNAVGPGAPTNATLGNGLAMLFPLELPEPYIVTKGWWRNGSAGLTGSLQIGVYTPDFALIGASAQVVQAGVDAIQEAAFSPVITVPRGLCYLAIATSALGAISGYNVFGGTTAIALQLSKMTGILLVTSGAWPLPATLSPVVTSAGAALICGIANRSLVT